MNPNRRSLLKLHAAALTLTFVGVLGLAQPAAHAKDAASNPGTPTQVDQPGHVAAQLSRNTGAKPVILQVGFNVLYRSKHIPGAIYAGPASTTAGLQTLKKAAGRLPKDAEIYIYCGCCPIDKCPNIRPAFQTLKAMGFTHLHVVMLKTNFGKDWVAHGYPIAGESASNRQLLPGKHFLICWLTHSSCGATLCPSSCSSLHFVQTGHCEQAAWPILRRCRI